MSSDGGRATDGRVEDAMSVGVAVAALVIGFLAGLLAFKTKSRWCPRCGSLTFVAVPECHDDQASTRPSVS